MPLAAAELQQKVPLLPGHVILVALDKRQQSLVPQHRKLARVQVEPDDGGLCDWWRIEWKVKIVLENHDVVVL